MFSKAESLKPFKELKDFGKESFIEWLKNQLFGQRSYQFFVLLTVQYHTNLPSELLKTI